ncbi:MAG: hypothetical protein MR807_04950 [Erysipelotrichaceae bacterium]|nr:hypothetical protein [Erysipelotrichaceae bacterium]
MNLQQSTASMWYEIQKENYPHYVLTHIEELKKHIDFIYWNPDWSWTNTLLVLFLAHKMNQQVSIMRTRAEWQSLFLKNKFPIIEEKAEKGIEYVPVYLDIFDTLEWKMPKDLDIHKMINIKSFDLNLNQELQLQEELYFLSEQCKKFESMGNITDMLCSGYGTEMDSQIDQLRFAFKAIAQKFIYDNKHGQEYIDLITDIFLYAYTKANKEPFIMTTITGIDEESALTLYIVIFNALHTLPDHIEYELQRKLQDNKRKQKLEMKQRLEKIGFSDWIGRLKKEKKIREVEEQLEELSDEEEE